MNQLLCRMQREEVDGETKSFFIATDETQDRYGEIVKADGLDVSEYEKNPLLFFNHQSGSFPIGTVKNLTKKTIKGVKAWIYEPEFHLKTEDSRIAKDLNDAGILTMSSIGFMILEMVENVITKSKLLEISLVGIPANPSAGPAKKQYIEKGYSEETVERWFPEDYRPRVKSLEEQVLEMQSKIESLTTSLKGVGGKQGRNPIQAARTVDEAAKRRRMALKAMNMAMEALNKTYK